MSRTETALAMVRGIVSGNVDFTLFTPDAQWWSNAGVFIPLADFNALLGSLHEQTVSGIEVTPGPAHIDGDKVYFEATSQAELKNGKSYANRYAFVVRFDGDLIAEAREYSDTAHVYDTFDISL